jgi:TonB family protein
MKHIFQPIYVMIHRYIVTVFVVLSLSWMPTHSLLGQVPEQEFPSPNDLIEVDQPPVVDLIALQKSIVYPSLAKRAGIEGRVIVRSLIGTDGKTVKSEILESPNEWFNETALDAVAKATAQPAMYKGNPIAVWTLIPITFLLGTSGSTYHPPTEHLLNYLTMLIATSEQNKPANLYSRGLAYYKNRQRDNAKSDFQRACELAPSVQWKPYSEAGKEEIAAIQIKTTDAASLTRRGELLLDYDLEQALADINAAIKADSNYLYAYAARTSVYTHKGMCAEAAQDAQKASRVFPETPGFLTELSRCYYERENYKQALLSSTRAVELAPSFASARYIAALAILRMADTNEKALDSYKEAYRMDDQDEELRSQAILDLQNLVKRNIRAKEAREILQEVFHVE